MFPSTRMIRFAATGIVLAALLVVLLVVLAHQKEESVRIASARNLQQWGIALNLCLMENGNQLPEVGKAPVTPEQTNAWFNLLPPYISEKPLAELPPGARPRPGVPSLWIRPGTKPVRSWDPEVFFFNYGMNRNLQPAEGSRSFRISELNYPGGVIFLTPTESYSPESTPADVVFSKATPPTALVLFCDGHVAPVPRTVLLDPASLSAGAAENGTSWFHE